MGFTTEGDRVSWWMSDRLYYVSLYIYVDVLMCQCVKVAITGKKL
ncbi:MULTISPECIES: hypothetical protein [Nostocaceae]|nr:MULTISPECIES: hypothetical protein [Nostocaceae]